MGIGLFGRLPADCLLTALPTANTNKCHCAFPQHGNGGGKGPHRLTNPREQLSRVGIGPQEHLTCLRGVSSEWLELGCVELAGETGLFQIVSEVFPVAACSGQPECLQHGAGLHHRRAPADPADPASPSRAGCSGNSAQLLHTRTADEVGRGRTRPTVRCLESTATVFPGPALQTSIFSPNIALCLDHANSCWNPTAVKLDFQCKTSNTRI